VFHEARVKFIWVRFDLAHKWNQWRFREKLKF